MTGIRVYYGNDNWSRQWDNAIAWVDSDKHLHVANLIMLRDVSDPTRNGTTKHTVAVFAPGVWGWWEVTESAETDD